MRDELFDGGDFFVFREVLDSAFAVDFFLMEDDFPAEELFEDMRERTLVIFPSVVLVFLGVLSTVNYNFISCSFIPRICYGKNRTYWFGKMG